MPQKCSYCQSQLLLIRNWNEKYHLTTCDNQGCKKYRNPVTPILISLVKQNPKDKKELTDTEIIDNYDSYMEKNK